MMQISFRFLFFGQYRRFNVILNAAAAPVSRPCFVVRCLPGKPPYGQFCAEVNATTQNKIVNAKKSLQTIFIIIQVCTTKCNGQPKSNSQIVFIRCV